LNLPLRIIPGFMKNSFLLSTLLVVLAVSGCKKAADQPAPDAAPAPKAASVSIDGADPSAPPPPPAPAQENADPNAAPPPNPAGDEIDPNLRAILIKFYNEQLHPAQSWDELMAGKYITKVPRGPDGKPLDWNKTMAAMGRAAMSGK
jgi:hypothetical protein